MNIEMKCKHHCIFIKGVNAKATLQSLTTKRMCVYMHMHKGKIHFLFNNGGVTVIQ